MENLALMFLVIYERPGGRNGLGEGYDV